MAPAGFCDLPTEALDSIARRVGPLDNVACSAVCRAWRRALKTTRLLRQMKRPDLPHYVCVEPRYECPWWETRFGEKKLPWDKKVCLRPPGCSRRQDFIGVAIDDSRHGSVHPTRVIGCGYGWIVTVDGACTLSLLEPLTGRRFPLPPIDLSIGRSKKVRKNLNTMGQEDMFRKAALAPGRRFGTYAVTLIHSGGYGLSFLAPGAKCWTALRTPTWNPKRYLDVVLHKGAFYTVSVDLELNAWAPDGSCTGLRARLVASPKTEPMWAVLVQSTTRDELLMVSTAVRGSGLYDGMSVKVWRYDESEGGRWTPAINRGDTTILVKENSGLCVRRRGEPRPMQETTERWCNDVSYSSNLACHMSYGSLFLRDGCWFLPYFAPVMPHK